jgi:hypothetical protein
LGFASCAAFEEPPAACHFTPGAAIDAPADQYRGAMQGRRGGQSFLLAVVDHCNSCFNLGLSSTQKADLVQFLKPGSSRSVAPVRRPCWNPSRAGSA